MLIIGMTDSSPKLQVLTFCELCKSLGYIIQIVIYSWIPIICNFESPIFIPFITIFSLVVFDWFFINCKENLVVYLPHNKGVKPKFFKFICYSLVVKH